MDTEGLLDLAVTAAHEAGSLLFERFQGPARGVSSKSTSTDPVSDADRDSEALILNLLTQARAEDGVLGEEGSGRESRSGFVWVIDPLDATVNFLFGIPWWCVSIALRDAEGELVGVTHNPILGETFAAVRGEGAWLNGAPIKVSERSELDSALIATGFAYDRDARTSQGRVAAEVLGAARDIRRMGSAALDFCSVACGRVDGFFESHLEEWDKAAGTLIVREAGGTVTELAPPKTGATPGAVASNGKIHEMLCRAVGG